MILLNQKPQALNINLFFPLEILVTLLLLPGFTNTVSLTRDRFNICYKCNYAYEISNFNGINYRLQGSILDMVLMIDSPCSLIQVSLV